ncbi:MAG: T9SS type A sorting domain-containing protein [Bacteroidia bacterium]
MKRKITLLLALMITSAYASAQLLYTFDSVKITSGTTDPSPVPVVTGATCGSFTAVGSAANSQAAARFDFDHQPNGSTGGLGDTIYATMTGMLNTGIYYEVTLTPQAGYTITGDSIKFSFERSSTGVRSYAVRSSLDGFTTNLTAVYLPPTTNVNVQPPNVFFLKKDVVTTQNRNVIVLGPSFANLSAPVTFRFYGWNAEGTGTSGTFSIDNVNFVGSSTLATGVSEKNPVSLSVYPNPSNGIFTADLGNTNGKSEIQVYNILGKVIYSKEVSANGKMSIDLSGEANGSYFMNVKNAAGTTTRKIIINN